MDGFDSGRMIGRNPREVKIPVNSSFTEMPWLLRNDLTDPQVQLELRRQMVLAKNSPDDQIWEDEIAQENQALYHKLEANEAR
ncbi:MAG: hypothetical protein QM523_10090 [Candidatus Pacebacteria bacterium]|nr:hypothetical protein [Candidatus Paceibacterota bacterium]